jgi:hypothetical protein
MPDYITARMRKKAKKGGFMCRCDIDKDDWEKGFQAGQAGEPNQPPPGLDGLAWASGYIEGQARQKKLKSAASLAKEINDGCSHSPP